jgi:hypothetical protein
MPIGSTWTDTGRINEWVKGADVADLNTSMTDAQADLYERLIRFICKATVDTWTDLTNTPDRVQYWTARMAAAIYLSKYQGYHLQPEIPDNPAANIYDSVLKELDEASYNGIIIIDQTGDIVPVNAITVTAPTRYAEYLPVSQGGDVEND